MQQPGRSSHAAYPVQRRRRPWRGWASVARVTLDANGQARLRGSFSVAGRYTIRAVYSGDATFDASSQSLIEQVNR